MKPTEQKQILLQEHTDWTKKTQDFIVSLIGKNLVRLEAYAYIFEEDGYAMLTKEEQICAIASFNGVLSVLLKNHCDWSNVPDEDMLEDGGWYSIYNDYVMTDATLYSILEYLNVEQYEKTECAETDEVNVVSFRCEPLGEYGDSMLYDSGINIAHVCLQKNGYTGVFDLQVQGEVRVYAGGNLYRHASQMSEDILQQFRDGTFYKNPNNETVENNWWEIIYTITTPNGKQFSDGYVLGDDPNSYKSNDEFLKDIKNEFETIIENEKK